MLLDRSKPNGCQSFGDYLNDLGRKNGFSDLNRFQLFLINSSSRMYYVHPTYKLTFQVISGLFIELGLDQAEMSDCAKPQCFLCVRGEPKNWVWKVPSKRRCKEQRTWHGHFFKSPRERFRTDREEFCGVIKCSLSRIGLDFSPEKAGLYYADMFSKEEHDESYIPRIYPTHKAFELLER